MDTEVVARFLAVIGPLLAALGAGLLAYDAFRGPLRWFDQVFLVRGRLKLAEELRAGRTRGFTVPPYSESDADQAKQNAESGYKQEVSEIQEQVAQKDLAERFRSRMLAGWGFLLVLIGSLMQAVAAALK